jgi:sigma-54 dependent transcriptional regulator, acetoin dehydrogenase operon transcriptional activator AcoR
VAQSGVTTARSGNASGGGPSRLAPDWGLTILHSPASALVGAYFPVDRELRFGRVAADDVDVAIDDAKISRRHAMLGRAGLVLELRDDGSSNGTFVNGERVAARMLRSGDIVRIGDTLGEIGTERPRPPSEDPTLVGTAPAFLDAVELASRVAASDLPVVILGETGSGKDVLARHIHARSGRPGELVAVNCAALPTDLADSALFGHRKGAFTGATGDNPGYFVEARDGTLFFDEVGELAPAHQAKLLRALEAHEIVPVGSTRRVAIDARVIAATNAELEVESQSGRFRADLYARLAGAVIRMPSLRHRRGDILPLAERFLAERPRARRFSTHAAERLLLHPWPQNIRQLRSTMRRLMLDLGDRTDVGSVDVDAVLAPPADPPGARRPGSRLGRPARDELIAELASSRGNISRVAERYGKDAKQIYRWLRHHGIDPDGYR